MVGTDRVKREKKSKEKVGREERETRRIDARALSL